MKQKRKSGPNTRRLGRPAVPDRTAAVIRAIPPHVLLVSGRPDDCTPGARLRTRSLTGCTEDGDRSKERFGETKPSSKKRPQLQATAAVMTAPSSDLGPSGRQTDLVRFARRDVAPSRRVACLHGRSSGRHV